MARKDEMGAKNLSRIKSGNKAKGFGDLFEAMLKTACNRFGVGCVRIPDGCVMRRGKGGAIIPIRVQTPFDYVIALDGRAAFIDCKTVESGNFTHSMIKAHQIASLSELESKKNVAGYVVWFRDVDKIMFFSAKELKAVKPKESIDLNAGIFLGSRSTFAPHRVFLFTPETD